MFSTGEILTFTAASAAPWKAISAFVLLMAVGLVLVILVKVLRLIKTGRTRRVEKDSAAQRASTPQATAAVSGPPAEYRPGTQLRSLRLTMSAAAFLVPMAMAVFLGMILATPNSRMFVPSENPFGIEMLWKYDTLVMSKWVMQRWEPFLILVFVAICLAGHVGLLRAAYASRAPTSADFFQGIKDHTLTFILGKLLLCLGVIAVSGTIGARVTWSGIFFVVPSLLLAPLVGTAALHPRKPGQAIAAALAHSTNDVHGTGKLVTIQVLLLLGAWIIYSAVQSPPPVPPPWYLHAGNSNILQIPLLANGVSTLSFNTCPMMPIFRGGIGEMAVIAFTVISSTVFLGCHFLKVMDTVQEQAAEKAGATAGQVA